MNSNSEDEVKHVYVYLSRRGCLGYVLHQLERNKDALLVVSSEQEYPFANEKINFEVSHKMTKMLYQTFGAFNKAGILLDKLAEKHKAIELHFPAFHPWNFIFLKVAQQRGIPTRLTVHDYITHKGEKSRLTERIQKASISRATKTIFLSEHVKNQAVKDYGSSEHFVVESHPILSTGIENQLPYSASPKLLFLGRIVEYKGVSNLMKSVEDLNIEKLTIAGEQKKRVFSKNKKIHFIDKYLSTAEMGKLLAKHHILVLPYLDASQSGILTMGVDAGMVMVVSQVGGLKEQLPSEAAVWCQPNVKSLKNAIKKLMDQPDLYDKIKTNVDVYKCACVAQET